jgi:hypothetical protein
MPRCDPCNCTFPTIQGAQTHYTFVHLKGSDRGEAGENASDTSSDDSSDGDEPSSSHDSEVNPGASDVTLNGDDYILDDLVGYPVGGFEAFEEPVTDSDKAGGGGSGEASSMELA